MLFDELEELGDVPHRLSFSVDQYFWRIDCFVAKHRSGKPPRLPADRVRIVPNGVPIPGTQAILSEPIVGAAWRLVPSKRVEYLKDMMDILVQRIPNASLTIAGGFDPRHEAYANLVTQYVLCCGAIECNLRGSEYQNVQPLPGIPVCLRYDFRRSRLSKRVPGGDGNGGACRRKSVRRNRGTNRPWRERIPNQRKFASQHGVRDEKLLREDRLRVRMGNAARRKVAASFSMESMLQGYLEAFAMAE